MNYLPPFAKLKTLAAIAVLVSILAVFGQQCSEVKLAKLENVSFLSIGENPFRLDPPTEYPQMRRLIFFVDMSQSMVSGPCLQDVDAGIGFSTTPAFQIYDPNKGTGSSVDHRASGVDCKVNPALPIVRSSILNRVVNLIAAPPVFLETHLGMDHEQNRIEILKKWILDSRKNNPALLVDRTKVMIIPISGGISQKKLDAKWKARTHEGSLFTFFDLADDRLPDLLQWLSEVHKENLEISESDDVWRYETRSMGTTAPGDLMQDLYRVVQTDMRGLNEKGLLSFTDYQFIHLTDGLISPVQKNIEDVLEMNASCSACARNPGSCSGTCGTLVRKMTDAWGTPANNDIGKIDFYFGLLQTLPSYFGAGYFKVDFVQLNKSRLAAAYPGEQPYFEKLQPYFESRAARLSIWQADNAEPPFRLIGDASKTTAYKVTNLYVLNLNARLDKTGQLKADSDGDGLFDEEEIEFKLDPTKPRSNGICLDSMRADPAFSSRCEAMVTAGICDQHLDSDGDGLNECEESLLATNPFDFDSDADGIPDSLEWLYGINPLMSDASLDSNGDGYLNTINFASGLRPQHDLKNMREDLYVHYEMNAKGKELVTHPALGEVLLELFEVLVKHIPTATARAIDSKQLPLVYVSRAGSGVSGGGPNVVPYNQQILSVSPAADRNTIVVLARMVDVTNTERAYWRLYKTEIPTSSQVTQPRLDLSLLKMIRATDRND